MQILKWAAVAVTALFALMNLGAVLEPDVGTGFRIAAAALGLAGVVATVGLGASRAWGRSAVIAVGALNVAAAVVGLVADEPGAVIGIVVGGLAVVLGALAPTASGEPVRA